MKPSEFIERAAPSLAVAFAAGFAALVSRSPPQFLFLSVPLCAAWITASIVASRGERRPSFQLVDLIAGLGTAVLLYLGARVSLWAGCGASLALCGPLEHIYSRFPTRSLAGGMVLGFFVAPAEELFWRSVIQPRFTERFGASLGIAASVSIAVFVALVTGEPLLALAILPTYAVWGALYLWRGSIVPCIVSHAAFTVAIATLAPARFS